MTPRIIAILMLVAVDAVAGSFTPLDPEPSTNNLALYPMTVSDGGAVVFGIFDLASLQQMFRWTATEGSTNLGYGMAYRTTPDGGVMVGQSLVVPYQAMRWTRNGGTVALGNFPLGPNNAATSVSADGSVVVGSVQMAAGVEAFRWTSETGVLGLGDIPGGSFCSIAADVTPDGAVNVGRGCGPSGTEAYRMSSDTFMVSLGDLPGGSVSATAQAVSANGTIVVGYSGSANGQSEAFRWTSADGMVGLGDLPGGPFESRAIAISNDGTVIIGSGRTDSGRAESFVWTTTNGMQTLASFFLERGVAIPTGWTKIWGNDISADGRWIVGYGIDTDGLLHGYLANITSISSTPLQGRLPLTPNGRDYQAYYDADLDITWVADANLAASDGFGIIGEGIGSDGAISWTTAQSWISAANAAHYLGVSDWRLPAMTDTAAPGCTAVGFDGTDCGYNVDPATSELAHLHIVTFGNSSAFNTSGAPSTTCSSASSCVFNRGALSYTPPSEMQDGPDDFYWTGATAAQTAACASIEGHAWVFSFQTGFQGCRHKSDVGGGHAWAVRDGDIGLVADLDEDGVVELADNCTLVANPTQLDGDGDGYGNMCDADLNNSGLTTTADFSLLRSCLNQLATSSPTCAVCDMNGSGTVTTADFGLLRARLNTAPGPSGLHP